MSILLRRVISGLIIYVKSRINFDNNVSDTNNKYIILYSIRKFSFKYYKIVTFFIIHSALNRHLVRRLYG